MQLYCGECAGVMRGHIPDNSIDLTVTSPPYGNIRSYNGYTFDFEAIATELYRATKPGGVVVWVVGDQTVNGSETLESFRQALFFKGLGFFVHDTMIYSKNSVSYPDSNRYFPSFEYMFVFSKGKPKTVNLIKDRKNRWGNALSYGKSSYRQIDGSSIIKEKRLIPEYSIRMNVWTINPSSLPGRGNDRFLHPATFPEAIPGDHIRSWSNPGDTVLDPMVGSGTTGIMAKRYGRNFIGIDISSEYVELARQRIANTMPPLPIFEQESAVIPPAQHELFIGQYA